MNRHVMLAHILSLVFLSHQAWAGQAVDQPRRPNIVLIVTDDQGYGDAGIHGNQQIRTPNIDRLALQGVEFTRFYVSPVCSPTRASLLTGRYHYRTGILHTSRGGAKMAGDEVTIAELLSQNGYRTGMFGKWHLGDNYPMRPQDQGFQEVLWHKSGGIGQTPDKPNSYFDPLLWQGERQVQKKGYCTDIFFSAAMDFTAANQDRPFFAYLPTNAPHAPHEISDRYAGFYRNAGLDETTARVYGMVQNIDDNLGRLLEHLRVLKLEDKTIVIFISDNGADTNRYNAGLRARKSSVYEGGIRGLCFLRWPGRWDSGRKIAELAGHIDLLATLLDLCGIQKPLELHVDGVSLVPLLSGKAVSHADRMLFIQCHRGLNPQRYQNVAAISQRFKLVGYPGSFANETLKVSMEDPDLELYDLESDSSEAFDVSGKYPEILSAFRKRYEAWFDDVRASRAFTPGEIHLGGKENPAVLCRYQDASHRLGLPHGWSVQVERGGTYEITMKRGPWVGPGHLVVKWQGKEQRKPLRENQPGAFFEISAGKGQLEVWIELDEGGRLVVSDNNTIGDVIIRLSDSL